MTPRQIELVRISFARLAPMAAAAGTLFYRRLFELNPALEALFKHDVQEQSHTLMQMIGLAVALLDRPAMLVHAIDALGRRHAVYGVKPHDYETGGDALIWALNEGLGEAFTPEVKDAWVAVYELISSTMQRAAATAAPFPDRTGFVR